MDSSTTLAGAYTTQIALTILRPFLRRLKDSAMIPMPNKSVIRNRGRLELSHRGFKAYLHALGGPTIAGNYAPQAGPHTGGVTSNMPLPDLFPTSPTTLGIIVWGFLSDEYGPIPGRDTGSLRNLRRRGDTPGPEMSRIAGATELRQILEEIAPYLTQHEFKNLTISVHLNDTFRAVRAASPNTLEQCTVTGNWHEYEPKRCCMWCKKKLCLDCQQCIREDYAKRIPVEKMYKKGVLQADKNHSLAAIRTVYTCAEDEFFNLHTEDPLEPPSEPCRCGEFIKSSSQPHDCKRNSDRHLCQECSHHNIKAMKVNMQLQRTGGEQKCFCCKKPADRKKTPVCILCYGLVPKGEQNDTDWCEYYLKTPSENSNEGSQGVEELVKGFEELEIKEESYEEMEVDNSADESSFVDDAADLEYYSDWDK